MMGVLQATWAMEDDCSGCQRRQLLGFMAPVGFSFNLSLTLNEGSCSDSWRATRVSLAVRSDNSVAAHTGFEEAGTGSA